MEIQLSHIPKQKQKELTIIAKLLSEFKRVEMVILFGSYARGNCSGLTSLLSEMPSVSYSYPFGYIKNYIV